MSISSIVMWFRLRGLVSSIELERLIKQLNDLGIRSVMKTSNCNGRWYLYIYYGSYVYVFELGVMYPNYYYLESYRVYDNDSYMS
jgi:hypothetical protein